MLRDLVGRENVAKFNFFIRPKLTFWRKELPFNGQKYRLKLYEELMQKIAFDGIVETGAYRGTTTELFAQSNKPVFTVESSKIFFDYASKKLRKYNNIYIYHGDSVTFLNKIPMGSRRLFFYLDAHWYNNLPLAEELKVIANRSEEAVVMIDDFCVPGTDYTYDDYGSGAVLDSSYLDSTQIPHFRFYPSTPPYAETGAKRGCVVLCFSRSVAVDLGAVRLL